MKYLIISLLILIVIGCGPCNKHKNDAKFEACYKVSESNMEAKIQYSLECAKGFNGGQEDAIYWLRECEEIAIKNYGVLVDPDDHNPYSQTRMCRTITQAKKKEESIYNN
jgi:hypothetical protein